MQKIAYVIIGLSSICLAICLINALLAWMFGVTVQEVSYIVLGLSLIMLIAVAIVLILAWMAKIY